MTRAVWSGGIRTAGRLALFTVAWLLLVALLIPLLLAIEEDQSLVTWLQSFAAELAITMSDPQVWIAIGVALLFGGVSLVFGTWVARTVGLLRSDAPAGETLGVGLASGLMVLAAWWAAIWSGGRSSFTPVAVGFAIALGLAVVHRVRRHAVPEAPVSAVESDGDVTPPPRSPRRRSLVFTALAGGVFVVAIALLYGATMAPSPRDGVQPVEYPDEAFYAVLGRDLAATGTETNLSPSGFTDLPGLPSQTWYHWGELWLASAVITVFGTAPLAARYFVVLPVLLLAAAALTGTLVRRMTGTASRGAYAFGFLACMFLAPIPFVWVTAFSSWAAGLIYWLTLYGLAAVAILLALYGLAVLGTRRPTWALGIFAGSAAALILPAHIVIALLAAVGVGSAWAIRIVRSLLTTHRLPTVSPIWRRTIIATVIALGTTVVWGLLTGHSLSGGSAVSPSVTPFNASWGVSVAAIYLGAGVLFAIPLAWALARRNRPAVADIYLGTIVLLIVGATVWGARLGDFNMLHVFFGGLTLIAAPVAAVAAYSVWARLRNTRRLLLSAGVVALCAIQLGVGAVQCLHQLEQFGPSEGSQPIAVSVLKTIRQLPPNAKLAYACEPLTEVAFTEPQLVSIDAHTDRRVIPMCFEADYFGALLGAPRSRQTMNASFVSAPQRLLYLDAAANPSSPAVAAFLKEHGIDYIYADAAHLNSLVSNAVPIATIGGAEILRLR